MLGMTLRARGLKSARGGRAGGEREGDALDSTRAAADDREALALERHIVAPPRRVPLHALELVLARHVGHDRLVERAGRGDEHVADHLERVVRLDIAERDRVLLGERVPPRADKLGVEAEVAVEPVSLDDALPVREDLVAARPFRREGRVEVRVEAVKVDRDVDAACKEEGGGSAQVGGWGEEGREVDARRAGPSRIAPDAADLACTLVDRQVDLVAELVLEADCLSDAGCEGEEEPRSARLARGGWQELKRTHRCHLRQSRRVLAVVAPRRGGPSCSS